MNIFDASALLTFLQGEQGAARVEEALQGGGACGAANWSEVAQKIRAHGRNWDLSRSLLVSYGVQVEAVTATGCGMGGPEMGTGRGAIPRRSAVHGTRRPTGCRHLDG